MAKRKRPVIPKFSSEEEERAFWEQVDVDEFLEGPADDIVLELKRRGRKRIVSSRWQAGRKKKVTLNLDEELLGQLKEAAKQRGISYQALAKEILRRGLEMLAK
jgi:predicted HicB family RNase H-like nuclease